MSEQREFQHNSVSSPIVTGAVGLVLVGAIVLLIHYWPFSRDRVSQALKQVLPTDLAINHFHTTYFPHPGCVVEGISFRQSSVDQGPTRLVVIQKLTIQANYWDMLIRPHHIYRILLDGLNIHLPPIGSNNGFGGAKFSFGNSTTTIGEIFANEAVLEIDRSAGPSLKFDVHELSLEFVGANSAMSYRLAMRNPLPPGEIHSNGTFGPWRSDAPGQTSMSGSFNFDQADLGVFGGIAGLLSSKGSFTGTLNHIVVRGGADLPNFEVTKSQHPVHLATLFTVLVDGLNGDVRIQDIQASFLRTSIEAKGDIVGRPGLPRKWTTLDLSAEDGRIEDILWLFVTKKHSPMSGVTSFRLHLTIPPEGRRFMQEVRLTGDFGVGAGQFRPKTQQRVDKLSDTSRGEKSPQNSEPSPEDVISDLNGHIELQNAIATFSDLSFTVPGAAANLSGTYGLLDQKIDFRGTLKMDAKVQQTTSGVKLLFARAFAPMFNKKKGSEIPIEMDGTFSRPHFGIDLIPKK